MAFTTLALVRQIPGMQNPLKFSDAYLETLIAAVTATIKRYTKQNLELKTYTEYHNGNEHPNLILTQRPTWSGVTQIAAGSSGVALPATTINVASTLNPDGTSAFDPGGRSGQQPTIAVQTGLTTWTVVTYAGTTSTSFTGCSGGEGTMSSSNGINGVSQPVVWIDFTGNFGQRQPDQSGNGPFGPQTLQVMGSNWMVDFSRQGPNGRGMTGMLTRTGGYAVGGWIGSYPSSGFGDRGKLAASRLPCWPRGQGNIKVQYSAGYETIPDDLVYAANTTIVQMTATQPVGQMLASESLGAYSYSVLSGSQNEEMIWVRNVLSYYKEMSW